MAVCSIPQDIPIAFTGTDATKITLQPGETIDVDVSFTTDDSGFACQQFGLQVSGLDPSGSTHSLGTASPADEDTTYTITITAPSLKGIWKLYGTLTWSTETPPVDALVLTGTNYIYLVIWNEQPEPTNSNSWGEQAKPAGGFTEQAAPSGGFTEQNEPTNANPWGEQDKPTGGFTEQGN